MLHLHGPPRIPQRAIRHSSLRCASLATTHSTGRGASPHAPSITNTLITQNTHPSMSAGGRAEGWLTPRQARATPPPPSRVPHAHTRTGTHAQPPRPHPWRHAPTRPPPPRHIKKKTSVDPAPSRALQCRRVSSPGEAPGLPSSQHPPLALSCCKWHLCSFCSKRAGRRFALSWRIGAGFSFSSAAGHRYCCALSSAAGHATAAGEALGSIT